MSGSAFDSVRLLPMKRTDRGDALATEVVVPEDAAVGSAGD